MKKILANLFIVLVFSSLPARFLSGLNAEFEYQGCMEGLLYIGHDDPEYICESVLDSHVNTPIWWLICALVLAYLIHATIGFWDPDNPDEN